MGDMFLKRLRSAARRWSALPAEGKAYYISWLSLVVSVGSAVLAYLAWQFSSESFFLEKHPRLLATAQPLGKSPDGKEEFLTMSLQPVAVRSTDQTRKMSDAYMLFIEARIAVSNNGALPTETAYVLVNGALDKAACGEEPFAGSGSYTLTGFQPGVIQTLQLKVSSPIIFTNEANARTCSEELLKQQLHVTLKMQTEVAGRKYRSTSKVLITRAGYQIPAERW